MNRLDSFMSFCDAFQDLNEIDCYQKYKNNKADDKYNKEYEKLKKERTKLENKMNKIIKDTRNKSRDDLMEESLNDKMRLDEINKRMRKLSDMHYKDNVINHMFDSYKTKLNNVKFTKKEGR